MRPSEIRAVLKGLGFFILAVVFWLMSSDVTISIRCLVVAYLAIEASDELAYAASENEP